MPEVVDKGYLYIAQPPLLKVGRGKKETYFKNERELNNYILKRICENKNIKFGNEGKLLSEHNLYLFVGDLSDYYTALSNLEKRGISSNLVEILIKKGVENKSFLQDNQKMLNRYLWRYQGILRLREDLSPTGL